MESGPPPATKPRPRRSHSALPKFSTSNNSTDVSSEHKKGHLSRHSLHHHHLSHSQRRHGKEPPNPSNLAPLNSDASKQSARTVEYAASSGGDSKPQSLAGVEGVREDAAPLVKVRPEDVTLERQRREARETELRHTLQGLSELSMSTTRRLDDIYYSILERVSQLHSTIDSLQELSSLTRNLHHGFEQEAGEMQTELQDQIGAFGGFQFQKNRIDSLESRIRRSKEKTDRLNGRLEAARKRIAVLEAQEGEWQATVNRRLAYFWSLLGVVAVLVIFIAIFNSHPAGETSSGTTTTNARYPANSTIPISVREILDGSKSHTVSSGTTSRDRLRLAPSARGEDNPLDRLFDEL